MKKIPQIALVLLLALGAENAEAAYIAIECSATSEVDIDKRQVKVEMTLANNGDEPARDIELSFATANRSEAAAKELPPGQKTTAKVNFTFDELAIDAPGRHILPFHIRYRDINEFPSSSPQALNIIVKYAPAAALQIIVDSPEPAPEYELAKEVRVAGRLLNIGTKPIRVDRLTLLAPLELFTAPPSVQLPLTIEPQKQGRFELSVTNISALPGSAYGCRVLASGIMAETRISDTRGLMLKIVRPGLQVRPVFLGLLALVITGSALYWLRQRKQTGS